MGAPRIGIFGRKVDRQVTDLRDALTAAGAAAQVVDFHNFPRFNLATLQRPGPCPFDDLNQAKAVRLDRLDLVHLRGPCFTPLAPDASADQLTRQQVRAHHRQQVAALSFQLALARHLARRVPVISPPDAFLHHRTKAQQYHLLARHGLPVPRTLVTCDPRQAQEFVAAQPTGAVVKPLAGGAEVVLASAAELRRALARPRPLMLQQYVKGRALRAYALGGELVSVGELHYDQRHVDWREHVERTTLLQPTTAQRDMVRRVARLLDLPYCGLDLELDAHTGETYLLDVNPAALYASWARMTGEPMAERLATYLLRVARGGDVWGG